MVLRCTFGLGTPVLCQSVWCTNGLWITELWSEYSFTFEISTLHWLVSFLLEGNKNRLNSVSIDRREVWNSSAGTFDHKQLHYIDEIFEL
ncbi:hypothetical protein DFS33DRAFT_1297688 [Desarmillaria ectypa]|nr:hypothetical protein DFS33DRAFT_1297688 [Desarmillaria ectypa]